LCSEHNYRAHNPTKSSLWRKTRRVFAFSRQYELKWQPPFYHVHISSADNSKLEMKRKPHAISLFTSPDHPLCSLFTLYLGGLRKRRRQRKKGRRDRWDRKDSQENNGSGCGAQGGDWNNNGRYTEWKWISSHFLQALISRL